MFFLRHLICLRCDATDIELPPVTYAANLIDKNFELVTPWRNRSKQIRRRFYYVKLGGTSSKFLSIRFAGICHWG